MCTVEPCIMDTCLKQTSHPYGQWFWSLAYPFFFLSMHTLLVQCTDTFYGPLSVHVYKQGSTVVCSTC